MIQDRSPLSFISNAYCLQYNSLVHGVIYCICILTSILPVGPFITPWIEEWRFNLESKSLLGSESLTTQRKGRRRMKGANGGGFVFSFYMAFGRMKNGPQTRSFWKPMMITLRGRMNNHCISSVLLFHSLPRKDRIVVIIYRFTREEILETSWHPVQRAVGRGKNETNRNLINERNSPRFDTSHVQQQFYFELFLFLILVTRLLAPFFIPSFRL